MWSLKVLTIFHRNTSTSVEIYFKFNSHSSRVLAIVNHRIIGDLYCASHVTRNGKTLWKNSWYLLSKLRGIDKFSASISDSLQLFPRPVVHQILILHVVATANHEQNHVLGCWLPTSQRGSTEVEKIAKWIVANEIASSEFFKNWMKASFELFETWF